MVGAWVFLMSRGARDDLVAQPLAPATLRARATLQGVQQAGRLAHERTGGRAGCTRGCRSLHLDIHSKNAHTHTSLSSTMSTMLRAIDATWEASARDSASLAVVLKRATVVGESVAVRCSVVVWRGGRSDGAAGATWREWARGNAAIGAVSARREAARRPVWHLSASAISLGRMLLCRNLAWVCCECAIW